MLVDGLRWRRSAEALDAENDAIFSNPLVPRHRVCSFHGNPLDAFRQDAVAVRLVLPRENLVTRHTHGARSDAIGLQLFLSVENQRDLGSAGNEHYFGRATRR